MTHEKLVTLLKNYAKEAIFRMDRNAWLILCDVVELHVPHEITLPDGNWGLTCMRCIGVYYPCKTIAEIENNLYD